MTNTLSAVGAIFLAYQLWKVYSFVQLHFLHKGQLDQYRNANDKTGERAWALVTGATDGIGRAFAEELCERGFNVVIHGRNEQKLQNLKNALKKRWPTQEVRTLQIDAGREPFDIYALQEGILALEPLQIRILINNVGGSGGAASFVELEKRTSDDIAMFSNVNARFPTEITRLLLPRLRQSSSAVIINIGSSSSEFGLPYLGIYAGNKSFNKSWSRSLTAEMRAENHKVEVLFLFVSAVATDNVPRPLTLFVPSARQLARSSLRKIGCGKTTAFAYWAHEIQAATFFALPGWVTERMIISLGKHEKADEEARLRKK